MSNVHLSFSGLLLLATLGDGLKGTALVISKLKQKPLEATAVAGSGSTDEEVMTQFYQAEPSGKHNGGDPFHLFVHVVISN
jgi:hypothetical protein